MGRLALAHRNCIGAQTPAAPETSMDDDAALAPLIDSAALLGLAVRPEWRDGVGTHLRATLALAALVTAFPLPDTAEPAPVFSA